MQRPSSQQDWINQPKKRQKQKNNVSNWGHSEDEVYPLKSHPPTRRQSQTKKKNELQSTTKSSTNGNVGGGHYTHHNQNKSATTASNKRKAKVQASPIHKSRASTSHNVRKEEKLRYSQNPRNTGKGRNRTYVKQYVHQSRHVDTSAEEQSSFSIPVEDGSENDFRISPQKRNQFRRTNTQSTDSFELEENVLPSRSTRSQTNTEIKPRNPRWTHDEKLTYAHGLHEHKADLQGKFKGTSGGRAAKNRAWRAISSIYY